MNLDENNIAITLRKVTGNLRLSQSNVAMFGNDDIRLLLSCIDELREEIREVRNRLAEYSDDTWRVDEILEKYEDAYRMADRREV